LAGETLFSAGLVAAGAVIGLVAWQGDPRLLPAAMLFPAIWSLAPYRAVASLASAAYFLAASRGLPQGVATFFASDLLTGIALWGIASIGFVLVHATLWTQRAGWSGPARYAIAAILMALPPFGIVGWAHPITAAGVIFPAMGWIGLLAAFMLLVGLASGRRWLPVALLLGLWGIAIVHWQPPPTPTGWVGVDTQLRDIIGPGTAYAFQTATIANVKAAVAAGAEVVVLPESAAGQWTATVERLWVERFRGQPAVIALGAILITREGYDNVLMEVSAAGARVLYRERMPVPVSMWRPWSDGSGSGSGARADFFANPVVTLAGRRIAPLICYEQLIVWPVLQSMLHTPDVIVSAGNGWWAAGTNIIAIQHANAEAWARLFGLPLVLAFNT